LETGEISLPQCGIEPANCMAGAQRVYPSEPGSCGSFTPQEFVEPHSPDVQGFVFDVNGNGSIEVQLPEADLSVFRELAELSWTGMPVIFLSKHICS
jgi:hypothetical protein